MEPELRSFFDKSLFLVAGWPFEQMANELGRYALEEGFGDLPDLLDVLENEPEGGQRHFDSEVEQAYTFLVGEAKAFLKEKESK